MDNPHTRRGIELSRLQNNYVPIKTVVYLPSYRNPVPITVQSIALSSIVN
jgi:hypothetical protein